MSNNLSAKKSAVVDILAHNIETKATDFVVNYTNLKSSNKKIAKFRQDALQQFLEQGYPNFRDEDWKYTNLRPVLSEDLRFIDYRAEDFNWAQEYAKSFSNDFINKLRESIRSRISSNKLTGSYLVVLDGFFIEELSEIKQDNNIDIALLNSVDSYFKTNGLKNAKVNKVANLVNATWQDGCYIHVHGDPLTKEEHSANNIFIIYVTTKLSQGKIVSCKNYIKLARNLSLNIFQEYLDVDSDAAFVDEGFNSGEMVKSINSNLCHTSANSNNNILFEIELDQDSTLNHYILQNNASNNYHVALYHVNQGKNSSYTNYNINLGAKLSRQDIIVQQNEERAFCSLNGLFLPDHTQHMDSHLKVYHNSSHGKSVQDYRGVLAGRGHGVFNSMVYVSEGTIDNNAEQSNKNILLSEHAEIDTKPELQIYADDVVCSHGATIGRLDENSLFYLQSRGINKLDAVKMLTHAFVKHVIDKVSNKQIASWLEQRVTQKLEAINQEL